MVPVFTVFITLFTMYVMTESVQIKFTNDHLLNDKNITEHVLSHSWNTKEIECARYCWGLGSCESFFYNPATAECQYHRTVFNTSVGGINQPGLQYYYIIKCQIEKGFQMLSDDGPCVKFHSDRKTWFEANQICDSYSPYSHLAVLNNQHKNDLVKAAGMAINDQLNSPVYIGLKEYGDDLGWVNGAEVVYTDWVNGTVSRSREECACMHRASDFQWSLFFCTNTRNYLCEIDVDVKTFEGHF